MKNKYALLIGFISLLFIALAFTAENSKILAINEDIPVGEFTSISISVPAKVYLEQSSRHSLEIKASESILKNIKAYTEDGKLIIERKDKKYRMNTEIVIHITAPVVEGISVAGSSTILAEKKFLAEELDLRVAGSGNIKFDDLKAEELDIRIAGSGNVSLIGSGAEEMEVAIAGSGNLEATAFMVAEFSGKISGSGNCKVFVSDDLNATIAGSGNIKYKGNPLINTTISGSGKVTSIND